VSAELAGTDATSSLGPVVIVGAGGMLGRAWQELLSKRGMAYEAFGRAELDIESDVQLQRAVRPGVRTVVNCAAWTDVDGAESQEEAATRVNGEAVGKLATRCAEVDAVLVHYSTDYVFSGRSTEPYLVDAPHEPVNAYGRGKALGEDLLFESGAAALLIRTSWVYAPWGGNFVRTMLRLGAEREALKVVDDQRGRPSSARELAANTLKLLEAGRRGRYHLTDDGDCTWCELARYIMDVAGLSCRIDPCTTQEFPRPASRPSYSVLDLSVAKAAIGEILPWQQAVRDAVLEAE